MMIVDDATCYSYFEPDCIFFLSSVLLSDLFRPLSSCYNQFRKKPYKTYPHQFSLTLSLSLFISLSLSVSVSLSLPLSLSFSLYLYLALSLSLSLSFSLPLSLSLSLYLSPPLFFAIYLRVPVSFSLTMSLSASRCLHLSVWLSICLSLSLFLSLSLSYSLLFCKQYRMLQNNLPWPAWTVALAPDYTLFMPVTVRSASAYQNSVPPLTPSAAQTTTGFISYFIIILSPCLNSIFYEYNLIFSTALQITLLL